MYQNIAKDTDCSRLTSRYLVRLEMLGMNSLLLGGDVLLELESVTQLRILHLDVT
ncbi:hypothetical protein JCM18905_2815 [Vibrio sp. JCM 18905]|nr:hypothetical protein JCM18905_2815 [Vibrio sp. JCM 18905]